MLPYKIYNAPGTYSDRFKRLADHAMPGAQGALVFHYGQHPNQIGHLRGERYWAAMEPIYRNALSALRPGGYMLLVIKDHILRGQRVRTADQTIELCQSLGFSLHDRWYRRVYPLAMWQHQRKKRGEPIVEEEDVLVLRKA